ncbi:hypothetical protein GCM10011581_45860 [Saccharopolyspora subtropica]|uniref:Uncharacterized protein n=1 Tax=Saccharopolyspora thermophila TaxID=89367 RepID=A0A917K954_9PSEU|nr:hypothetical protein [Saccharopolyspora subtropica]GGJ03631.1 hypothetical protein GCM10011581_45860 [Saccharopolyspora subtropica]
MRVEQNRVRHELLLQLAQVLPDEVVWQSRRWLAADQWGHAARLIIQFLAEWDEPVPPGARAVLLDGADGAAAERLAQLGDAEDIAVHRWQFWSQEDSTAQQYAEVVGSYLQSQPGTHTAWQAWCLPEDAPAIVARPVHLVETEGGADPVLIAAELADRLWDAGLATPQVEVFRPDSPLDAYYHVAALVSGREIHATAPRPVIELARFDAATQDREPPGPQRDAQLAYLNSGEPLTEEGELIPDLFADDDEPVVPVTLRTDGTWIWSGLTTYYLETRGIALPEAFRAHIAESGPTARTPTYRERVAMVHLDTALDTSGT